MKLFPIISSLIPRIVLATSSPNSFPMFHQHREQRGSQKEIADNFNGGMGILTQLLPPEQRGMMMMVGKVMHATEEAQRTGSMGGALRELICDHEIKNMAVTGLEKVADNFMPSELKSMSLRSSKNLQSPDGGEVVNDKPLSLGEMIRSNPEHSMSLLSRAAFTEGSKYLLNRVVCSPAQTDTPTNIQLLEKQTPVQEQSSSITGATANKNDANQFTQQTPLLAKAPKTLGAMISGDAK